MAEVTEQIVREAPEIEAYKLGLLKSAKELADQPITLPQQQIAEQAFLQQEAARLAGEGIGAYRPYLTEGGYSMGDAYQALAGPQALSTEAAELYRQGSMGPSAEMIQGYMNPYQDAIQAEINRAFDIQQTQAAGQAVGAGAFGGSRGQVAQNEIDRNRASALAQSQAQNFLQAQQGATNELQRQLAAAQAFWFCSCMSGGYRRWKKSCTTCLNTAPQRGCLLTRLNLTKGLRLVLLQVQSIIMVIV